jgi:hypothetical protein
MAWDWKVDERRCKGCGSGMRKRWKERRRREKGTN